MKSFLLVLVLWLPLQQDGDFEKAKRTAAEEHKLILLNFSGSDWCGPCIAFTRDYLGAAEFKSFAADHLIVLNADFPRKKKNQLPDTTVKRNEQLAERYNPKGLFPYTLLLDANGKVLKAWEGKPDAAVQGWVSELQSDLTKSR